MKSWLIKTEDHRMVLELHDVDMPQPQAGQLRVRVHAAALNRGELIAGHGLHASGSPAKPAGFEAAGIVEAVGPGCERFRVGDAVMGRCDGAFSEYGLMHEGEALPKPAALSWAQAGCATVTYLTAHDALIAQGRLQAGEWVLVNSITSGVGVAVLQVARLLGAKVIGTSGSQAKLDQLRALGLEVGLCTRAPDFVDAVLQATDGRGADVCVNMVGASVMAANIEALGFQGRLAIVGYVDGQVQAPVNLLSLHKKRLHLYGVSNKMRTLALRIEAAKAFERDLGPALAAGQLVPHVEAEFAFEDLHRAQQCMEQNQHLGKLVLCMP